MKKEVRLLFAHQGEGPWPAAADLSEAGPGGAGGKEAAVSAYFRSMHREVLNEPIPQTLLDALAPLRRC
ncbi:MAG: hypothetical protein U1E53_23495 [Dongiaceae bacterium]